MTRRCSFCAAPAIARWYYDQSGYKCALCESDLNIWLDNADEEPALEPTRLEFIS